MASRPSLLTRQLNEQNASTTSTSGSNGVRKISPTTASPPSSHSPVVSSPLAVSAYSQHHNPSGLSSIPIKGSTLDSAVDGSGSGKTVRIYKSGWLYRRSHKQWKRRWFVLRDEQLTFYKDEREYKVDGIIPTAEIMSAAMVNDTSHQSDNSCKFAVITNANNIHFKADTGVDAHSWVDILRQAAHESSMASSYKRENILSKMGGSAASPGAVASSSVQEGGIAFPSGFGHKEDQGLQPLASPSAFSGSFDGFSSSGASDEHLPQTSTAAAVVAEGGEATDAAASDSQEKEQTIQSGYVQRLKRHYNKWIVQYAVVTSKRVLFYKKHTDQIPLKVIDLHEIADVVEIDPLSKSRHFCMQIITAEKRMRFCLESEEELTQWLASFKLVGVGH